jgi:glycosyltransferase involved in cell wall biosynthesis
VDQFIAPSAFLAARYAAWGVPESRIHIIENLLRTPDRLRIPEKPRTDPMLRIGFFGQISWLKGCNVLLDAAAILADNHVTNIVFDIHGDDRGQPPAFQNEFRERLGKASSNVVYHGPYENDTVDRLMEGVDAVLVPSVWWENSPLVIQEARRNRKPVLCSDIGGMAEKVRDGKDGFHFRSGDALSLVALLQRLVDERTLLQNLQDTMAQPDASANIMARHRHVYSGSGPCPAI